jgi:hypothetical protein
MVKCGVLFEFATEFLNVIYRSFGFKGLKRALIPTELHIILHFLLQ